MDVQANNPARQSAETLPDQAPDVSSESPIHAEKLLPAPMAFNNLPPALLHTRNPPERRGITFWLQFGAAMAIALAAFIPLTLNKVGSFPDYYRTLGIIAVLTALPIYAFMRCYEKRSGYLMGCMRVMSAWSTTFAALAIIGFLTKSSTLFSRELLGTWFALGLALQLAGFCALHALARRSEQQLDTAKRVLILGTGPFARQLAQRLVERGESVKGYVSLGPENAFSHSKTAPLGDVSEIREIIERTVARKLYLALPLGNAASLEELYLDLIDLPVDIIWVPDVPSVMLSTQGIGDISGLPAIALNDSPLTNSNSATFAKALIDRIGAALAIALLSPIMAATAIAIKLDSKGPILFKQLRHGVGGTVFEVWKFRSMRQHDDEGVTQATRYDDRVTKVGRWLRKTSLDEIPQFFNVLQGHMSLVGPRPHAVEHNDHYGDKIQAYLSRHRIKPGVTGLAQISGYRGETADLELMQRRVELDLAYITHWSLYLDLKILARTPMIALFGDAY